MTDKVVLVLAPMRIELQPLVHRLSLRPASVAGTRVHTRATGGLRVIAAQAGIGTSAAAGTAERLLGAADVGRVVVSGIAGSIDPDLSIGSLVHPQVVIDRSTGLEYRPAPLGNDPAGAIATSDELVSGQEEMKSLADRGVVAVDMETAAVAEVCERLGREWSVVRSISDRVSEQAVDDTVVGMVERNGDMNMGAAARYLLRHPRRTPHLARLARDSTVAARAAASSVARWVATLDR